MIDNIVTSWLRILPVLMLAALALTACGRENSMPTDFTTQTRWILEAPDTFELPAVDPQSPEPAVAKTQPAHFQDFIILGRVRPDTGKQRVLVNALYAAVVKPNTQRSKCFNVRHAIRASREGHTTELLICFECQHVFVYTDNAISGDVDFTNVPRDLFNQTLIAGGVTPATLPSEK